MENQDFPFFSFFFFFALKASINMIVNKQLHVSGPQCPSVWNKGEDSTRIREQLCRRKCVNTCEVLRQNPACSQCYRMLVR